MADEKNGRRLFINGQITDSSLNSIVDSILKFNREDAEKEEELKNHEREPIILVVNSFGGSVYAANGLLNIIGLSKTPIHTYCYEKAMSAGFAIFCAGTKRFGHKDATFMFHDMSYMMQGNLQQHKEYTEWYTELGKVATRVILSNTRITKKQLEKMCETKKDWYMTGEEAKKLDVCTDIMEELF